jgi:hypothetical protein
MKVIQVPMDNKLLREMNLEAKASRSSRATVIRKACEEYIRRLENEELDRQYIEGYHRKPEDPVWGEIGEMMAGEVWPQEEWDEDLSAPPASRRSLSFPSRERSGR